MLTLIEAYRYRCLRYVRQPLGPVHVLVGPNASGKTTFLDVVAFLGDLVSQGLDEAIRARTQNPQDLLWKRQGAGFELAIEAAIPEEIRSAFLARDESYDTVRYEVAIDCGDGVGAASIRAEKVLLKSADEPQGVTQRELFPAPREGPSKGTIMTPRGRRGTRTVVNKAPGGKDSFRPEDGKGWTAAFQFGPQRSALANLPADETKFPVATWLKGLLTEGVQPLVLNSLLLRKASPPGQGRGFRPDGANLPWVIEELRSKAPGRLEDWIAHLQTALPDLIGIRTVERPDDRHRYLILQYRGGNGETPEIPSWVASDGTLRLLALTLPAYIPDIGSIYLIEEPENGVHPRAVETLFQSLSSVYGAQILLATHSPVILGLARAEQVLCFAKTPDGATDIVAGDQHPALRDWRGEVNLGVLFAAGVLG